MWVGTRDTWTILAEEGNDFPDVSERLNWYLLKGNYCSSYAMRWELWENGLWLQTVDFDTDHRYVPMIRNGKMIFSTKIDLMGV
jgi:hypothetical protein